MASKPAPAPTGLQAQALELLSVMERLCTSLEGFVTSGAHLEICLSLLEEIMTFASLTPPLLGKFPSCLLYF